ncbi:MAG: type IV pilus secretin PilQ [Deltaproteobacteria bacterium]|jgi:type IV pilus assembly protein PilQ|nr:type IV pilus secretin PilQ [Deltaproteobacteria bacterium]
MAIFLVNGNALGADANKLTAVSLDSAAAEATILIETERPVGYRYTVYDSFEPTRVVIDFPDMELSELEETLAVAKGPIQEVRVAGFELTSGQLARVEILLSESTEYQVSLDGQKFRVAFTNAAEEPAMAEAKSVEPSPETPVATVTAPVDSSVDANVLLKVDYSPSQAVIQADGKIDNFKYFTLKNPARLVVDVYGLKPAFKERVFPAGKGFKQIRLGTYDDKTRLVFDGSGAKLPQHNVESRDADILVTWGEVATANVEEQTPEMAAEKVAEPVAKKVLMPAKGPAAVEAIDFNNEDGRSVIAVTLSNPAKVTGPIAEGNLVRFEIIDSSISRALRRKIDASAFPSAVTSVTPYTVTDDDHQNVRIAVNLKGQVSYALEEDGTDIRLVIDDGAYAEPVPPAVSTVEVVAPERPESAVRAAEEQVYAPTSSTVTADEMAAEAARYNGEKITLVFDAANVRSILQLIGDVSGLNILASSDVQGTITLRLIDVPWDQALDLVLETASLGKIQQGNILRIMPKDKLRSIEQEAMQEQMIAIEEGVLETKTFLVSYASVDDMKNFLTDIKSDRGSIIADSRNKQLIVRDAAAVLEQMEEMIVQIDKPERQVMIEARIVEANTTFSRNLGIKWNFDYQQDDTHSDNGLNDAALGIGGSFILPVTNPAVAGASSIFSFGALDEQLDIDLRLAALENSGEGRIVSTPKVTTLNGEQATISQGTKIPFSSVSDQGTDVQFENAELKLSVTPEINPDGSILLEIDTSNSSVGSVVPTATGDAVSIDEKKAQTKVLVRNGQTTVIGGIFIEQEQKSQSGVPILMDVPVLGHLFKSTSKTKDRRELLIFITPRIVES